MGLPGFMPTVGDAFGQNRNDGVLTPGLDFAFGLIDDNYIDKAKERGWLLTNSTASTPATTSRTEDLQLKVTLEPVKNLKIDLMASRNETTAKRIQYMNAGNPTSQSGNLTMTTISIRSALEGMGDANDGYYSRSFEEFCGKVASFRDRVQAQYANAVYPAGTAFAGQRFDPANGEVNKYSADVMVPAFLSAYTKMGSKKLNIFPTLTQLLPNWTIRYSGLGKLPWFRDVFKSVNLNHAYKSIYSVGSYNSYSTFMEYMNGLGFISDTQTGNPIPSSMYNVSTVSINESFSPLLGIDVTLQNNLTAKLEYRTSRVLALSMTSVQINENRSNDWVIGLGYKINNFRFLAGKNRRLVKGNRNNQDDNRNARQNVKGGSHDLNLRLDISLKEQTAISRDIASRTSNASSGSKAFALKFMADYTLSKLLTMTFFYDHQTNTPLLTSSSYPTTTRDFGFSLKMSLTR
jgi:cell surface protein SprA